MSLIEKNALPKITDSQWEEAIYNHKSLVPIPVSINGVPVQEENFVSNERLAFLGDQVVHMCVTDVLYSRFLTVSTGDLNDKRELCVKKKQLAKWSVQYGLPEKIRAPDHQRQSIKYSDLRQAQVLQAYLAAVFIMQGYGVVREWFNNLLYMTLDQLIEDDLAEQMGQTTVNDDTASSSTSSTRPTSAKSPPRPNAGSPQAGKTHLGLLNEIIQQKGYQPPEWTATEKGLSHQKTFTMTLKIKERPDILVEGTGKGKQEAKHMAAAQAIGLLLREPSPTAGI